MFRSPVNSQQDAAHFSRTANTVKKVNLGQKIMRGGIRF